LVSLVVFLTLVSTCIIFLPFFLLAFDVNGQTNLILGIIYQLKMVIDRRIILKCIIINYTTYGK
jgi:hypothetical protein